MNTAQFIEKQREYFSESYEQFVAFGGPCVYFHDECLQAGHASFLSKRHVEMLYATLTAWGMHRMGNARTTKAKLTTWEQFYGSISKHTKSLRKFLKYEMLTMSEGDYANAIQLLRPYYEALELSTSKATIVINSKALHHLFPNFVPPIDRQHTMRFFKSSPQSWRNTNGKYRSVRLPVSRIAQFDLFQKTCVDMKRIADQVDPIIFDEQLQCYGVAAPKAMDNAIVNYVRTFSQPATTLSGKPSRLEIKASKIKP